MKKSIPLAALILPFFILPNASFAASATPFAAVPVKDHLAIATSANTVWAGMIGFGFTVTNPTNKPLTLKTLSFHIPTEVQSNISNILALENIASDVPSYNSNRQEYTFIMSNSGQTLQPSESIQSMFYVQTRDSGSEIADSPIAIYANEGQLLFTLSPTDTALPTLNATVTSQQGDVDLSQPLSANAEPIALPGNALNGAAYQVSLGAAATQNRDGSITEVIPSPTTQEVDVVSGKTAKANFQSQVKNYAQESMHPVNVSIDSLPSSGMSGTISATSTNHLTFTSNAHFSSSFSTAMMLPNDGQTYTIKPSVPGYNLSGSCTNDSNEIDCHYSAQVQHLMVGYWADWGPWSISQTAEQGYNMLIIAFGSIDNSGPSLAAFGPDNSKVNLIKDIQAAKVAHPDLSVLISFGGANNTYFIDDNSSDAQIDKLASQLNDFLDEYGLDGVDFDIESKFSYHVMHTLIHDLQTHRKAASKTPYIVTAAPQFNTGADGSGQIVSHGHEPKPYYQSLTDTSGLADFNYVMLQEYNTPLSPPYLSNNTKLYENNFEMISATFNDLKSMLPSNSTTKLVIGEPASFHSASPAGIFYDFTGSAYNQRDLETVVNGVNSQVSQIKGDPKFGGIMEWDTYDDQIYNAGAPYGFAKGIIPCVIHGQCSGS
ncbi:glycoside hydrolase family 18 protein [Vibrio profundum]|uniref:glycosyl hydrolase family 18 protein n=1 Tax=Vibrio profundum TaxID=2910247 RepID=UPI003D0E333C